MSLKQEVNKILGDIENPNGAGIPVVFYDKSCYMEDASKENGKPTYETRLYVRKHKDSLSIYDCVARDEDIKQSPKQYEIYLKTNEAKSSGIPIGMLPAITPSQVSTCEACRVFTIEQLSLADDIVIMDIGDKTLRDRATAYLNGESEKDVEIAKLKKLLEGKDDNSNDSAGCSERESTVRATNKPSSKPKQGSKTILKLPENS